MQAPDWLTSITQNLAANAVWYLLTLLGGAFFLIIKKWLPNWLALAVYGLIGMILFGVVLFSSTLYAKWPLATPLILVASLIVAAGLHLASVLIERKQKPSDTATSVLNHSQCQETIGKLESTISKLRAEEPPLPLIQSSTLYKALADKYEDATAQLKQHEQLLATHELSQTELRTARQEYAEVKAGLAGKKQQCKDLQREKDALSNALTECRSNVGNLEQALRVAQSRVEEMESVTKASDATKRYEWVHRIADHQAKNIRDFVFVSRVGVWEDQLNDAIPTIKWGFMIQNKSLFPISLVEVRNNVFFEKIELAERRFEDHNEVEQLGYWRSGSVTFKQRLSPIEAQHIRNTPDGKFRFNRLEIIVANPNSIPVIEPQELTIGDDLETKRNVLTYKETEGMKRLNNEIALLKRQAEEREAQSQKPSLVFEIDEHGTRVDRRGHSNDATLIAAKVPLRFSKSVDSKLAVRDFNAALFSATEGAEVLMLGHVQIIAYSPNRELISVKDGLIIDVPLTLFYEYSFFFHIKDEIMTALLSPIGKHFIRVTMNVIGQSPQYIDFFVNSWPDVFKSNSSITLRR